MADPYTLDLQVRFRDLDPMSHVNNAIYSSYLEQARAGFFREVVGEPLEAVDTVLAHLDIDFREPIESDDAVTVSLEPPELGTSSITMNYEVRADDGSGDRRLAATATTVQVLLDFETGESRPLPDRWRRRVDEWAGR